MSDFSWMIKMYRIFSTKTYITLVFLLLLPGVAHAWSPFNLLSVPNEDVQDKLDEIDWKAKTLAKNKWVMSHINSNMFEQDVKVIEISIKNDNEIVKNFYIIRAKNQKGKAILSDRSPKKTGTTWKFEPDIDQAIECLDLVFETLSMYDEYDGSTVSKLAIVSNLIEAGYLYLQVENENIPPVNSIIDRSSCNKCKKALKLCGCSYLFY